MSKLTNAQKLAETLDRATQKLEQRRRERRAAETANGGPVTRKSSSRERASRRPDHNAVLDSPFGNPFIRKGEDSMGSRGYEFTRVAKLALGMIGPEHCRVELEAHQLIDDAMNSNQGFVGRTMKSSIFAPLCPALMRGSGGNALLAPQQTRELSQKMWLSTAQADPAEMEWLTKKAGVQNSLTNKNWTPDSQKAAVPQSWMQQEFGGALVPPPEWGPLIPLLRNQAAVLNAGATVQPLPPGGRIVMPRQTTASIVYHAGEGQAGTQTNVQTDQFELSPKLIIGLFVVNNQLLKFGGPAVEQMLRNDLTLSLSLQMDFDCLQGAGSNNVIAGLLGYPGVQSYAGDGVATNGNAFQATDVYSMRAKVFAANAPEFTSWIMHPLLAGAVSGARGGTGAGANTGPFLFDITRGFEDGVLVERLALAKLVQSTNCPTNRPKGSATNLTAVYGGWWPNYIVGMYGSIELAIAQEGQPYFAQYQTQLRGVLQADAGPRNPGTFITYDQVVNASPVS